jgi:hypothetical protein
MKRCVFLSLLLTAAALLLSVFSLLGCQDLNTTDVTPTYPSTSTSVSQTTTSGLEAQTDTSVQAPASTPTTSGKTPPTIAKATTTTVKLVGQLQTQLTLELVLPATRYEDTDPLMKWTGAWTLSAYNKASGGTYHLTQVMGANVLVKFKGTSISLVVFKQPEMGIAKLTLDGTVYLVDLYSPDYQSKTVWTSPVLAYGTHQLRVEESGNKNPAASWPFITIDAVDVQGTLVP